MTSPKFDLATELLKGGLPRMAQSIASLFRTGTYYVTAEAWLASLSAATPPANVEQPTTVGARLMCLAHGRAEPCIYCVADSANDLAGTPQVEGATGANAERSELELLHRAYAEKIAHFNDQAAKLSTSEARVRELEAALERLVAG